MTHDTRDTHKCGYCGQTGLMRVLAGCEVMDRDIDDQILETGTRYEVAACAVCRQLSVLQGGWHTTFADDEDSYSRFVPTLVCPATDYHVGVDMIRTRKQEQEHMRLACEQARKCVSEPGKVSPLVGAVAAKDGELIASAFRGEVRPGDHAEYTLLEDKCARSTLVGATVYTTLEPCTERSDPKRPCANRLIERRVARVCIGMLDPDERIRGLGVLKLRKSGIVVEFFPQDLMAEIEELNREFIADRERWCRAAIGRLGKRITQPLSRLLRKA